MGKLSDEDNAALEALLAKRDADDDEDSDEIEWWEEDEAGKRRGGRMSVGRAKKTGLFSDLFGDKTPEPKTGESDTGKKPAKNGDLNQFFGRGKSSGQE